MFINPEWLFLMQGNTVASTKAKEDWEVASVFQVCFVSNFSKIKFRTVSSGMQFGELTVQNHDSGQSIWGLKHELCQAVIINMKNKFM